MTLMFGTAAGLALGIALGRTRLSLTLTALAWYVFLTFQTAYLAQPGATGFGGSDGSDILRGPVYWVAQPILLAVTIGLLMIGAVLRRQLLSRAKG